MKKDQEKQAELKATGANELPKFQIPELENPENFIKPEGENNEERNTTNLTRDESADSGDGILKK